MKGELMTCRRRPGASSRKTRIETGCLRGASDRPDSVRARVPEKQGLKPEPAVDSHDVQHGPGASSRKTRIETWIDGGGQPGKRRPGASSRKTRIETRSRYPARRFPAPSGREFQKNKD